MRRTLRLLLALASTATACDQSAPIRDPDAASDDHDGRVFFERRTFVPEPDVTRFLTDGRRHGLLQFYEQPQDLDAIHALGIEIHGANRHHSYYVTVPHELSSAALRQAGARALFSMQPLDRLSSRLVALTKPRTDRSVASVGIAMHFATTADPNEVRHTLRRLGASSVLIDDARGRATAELSSSAVLELARHEWIWWIDRATGPLTPDLDVAMERIGARELQPPPWGLAPAGSGLTGDGVAVGIWEVPALGAAAVLEEHPDLVGRVTTAPGQNAVPSPHATRVAGVIAGDGTASQLEGGAPSQWAGLAPQAHVFSWDATDAAAEMATSLALFGTTITSHSFGTFITAEPECGAAGFYDPLAAEYDDIVVSSGITAAVSPGNNGEQVGAVGCAVEVWDDGGLAPLAPETIDEGYGSVTVLGVAKNPIAVGGRRKSSPPGVAAYSGRGPTRDGRLKPDIVAVSGDEESLLAMPSTPQTYDSDLGVSYATPQVAGAAALLLEHYRLGDPSFVQDPAVFKAVLANTAVDVGAPGPDYSNGYGRLDLPRALAAADSYLTVVLDQGSVETISIGADVSGSCGLRVMAAWSDPPSMGASPTQLVNDIDLSVFSGDVEVLPWVLTPGNPLNTATRGINSIDNVEQVTVDTPSGNELVRLVGTNVQLGPQQVAVHWFAVPCGDAGGTGTSEGDESGGAGCACASAPESANLLPYLGFLLLSIARGRTRPQAAHTHRRRRRAKSRPRHGVALDLPDVPELHANSRATPRNPKTPQSGV